MKKNKLPDHPTIKSYQDAKAKLINEGKSILCDCATAFLDKHKDVDALFFQGYTPSFNDGDPCYFTFGNFGIMFKDEDTQYDIDSEFDDPIKEKIFKHVSPDIGIFQNYVQDIDCIEDIFGTNFTAIFQRDNVKKGKVAIEEFDCGY